MQALIRKFGNLVDIQGWEPGKILSRKEDNSGFEWKKILPTSEYSTLIAGDNISGGIVVMLSSTGTVLPANSSDQSHAMRIVGITEHSASSSSSIRIITSGELEDSSFTFIPNKPIYFDQLGRLTQTVPTTGFIQCIGIAFTSTLICVNLQQPIII